MALVFLDSFDHYSTAQGSRKWTTWDGAISTGRTNNGVNVSPFGPSKTLDNEYLVLTIGASYRTEAFSNAIYIFNNQLNGLSVSVEHVGDGRHRFVYAPGGSGPNVSTHVMSVNEWYYIEFRCEVEIENTSGDNGKITFQPMLWFNGELVLSETFEVNITNYSTYVPSGVNHCKFSRITLRGPGGGSTGKFDDLYLTDDERLGDVKVYVLYPNAAGDSTEWTPTGAAANWDCTEEHPADDDTSYVSSPTAGQQDLYNLDNIGAGFTGTIKGAQALWLIKKDDMGAGIVAGLWKSAGTTEQGTDFYPSALNYLYVRQAERKSLFTGLDWTESEINALQLGIKRVV